MKRNRLMEGLQLLENKGWSDIIDKRWKNDVIEDLKEIDGITDKEIAEILETVLW